MIVRGAVHILPIQTSLIQSFKRRGIEGWLGQRLCFSQVLVFCQWEWFLHSYSFMIAWFLLDWLYLWLWWLQSYSHSWRRFDSYIMSGLLRDFPRFTCVAHIVAIVLRLVVSVNLRIVQLWDLMAFIFPQNHYIGRQLLIMRTCTWWFMEGHE